MYKARKDAVKISTLFSGQLKKTCGKCGCNWEELSQGTFKRSFISAP